MEFWAGEEDSDATGILWDSFLKKKKNTKK